MLNALITSIGIRVEIGSGHPGCLGHVLSRSSGSDPVYEISGCDSNSVLNHIR